MKIIGSVILLTGLQLSFAQSPQLLRHTKTDEFQFDFYVAEDDAKVKYQDTLSYYWYKARKIHSTQGFAEGNILNGPFSKFYHSGALAEQGVFHLGLRDGTWRHWYESGVLRAVYNYDKGLLEGEFTCYDPDGQRSRSGKFKNGLLHGEFIDLEKGDTIQYKRGQIEVKEDKEPKEKVEEKGSWLKKIFNREQKDNADKVKKDKEPLMKRLFGRKDRSEKAPKEKKSGN